MKCQGISTLRKPRAVHSVKLSDAHLKRVGLPATQIKRWGIIEKRLLSTFIGRAKKAIHYNTGSTKLAEILQCLTQLL